LERRAIAELISEAERLLNGSLVRVEEERQIIARRKAIGADLSESMKLLKNLQIRIEVRRQRLRLLRRWLAQ